jgi:hypothetical protein
MKGLGCFFAFRQRSPHVYKLSSQPCHDHFKTFLQAAFMASNVNGIQNNYRELKACVVLMYQFVQSEGKMRGSVEFGWGTRPSSKFYTPPWHVSLEYY